MFSPSIFWTWLTGLTFLVIGSIAVRKDVAAAGGLNKLIVLGRVFVAASLALFGGEHLAGARTIMQVVPPWMPGRLFWAYFVGVALIAAALSIVLMKYVRLSATLLGIMFCLFVATIHLPRVAANPGDRIAWAVALREVAFSGGAWALAATQTREWRETGSHWLVTMARVCTGIPLVFFAVEHLLHPANVPGVPLEKLTPLWIPVRVVWGYLTGAVLLVTGAAVLANRQARTAATWLGLLITLLVLGIYLPILVAARQAPEIMEGLNYFADTLLFGGTVLVLASAMPKDN